MTDLIAPDVEPLEELEIEELEEDGQDLHLADTNRTIHTQPSDPDIDGLYKRWKRGKLVLQPDFQRQYVWDHAKASRLVESVLLSVPLPIIYLAEEADGKAAVIDGQQRLTALFSFIDAKHPAGETFKLTGLNVLTELNGETFPQLEDVHQDTFREYPIRVVTILKDSHADLKFEIFERLNTGSVPLNDMELRNCVYRGEYIALLKELADLPDFRELMGLKKPDRRMREVEFVLRFAAFHHASYLKYQPPMRRFLNQDMQARQHITKDDADDLRRAFKTALAVSKSLFGDHAFKRFYRGTDENRDGYWEPKKFNASLYDVVMGVFAGADKPRVYACLDSLREAVVDLMANNDEFIETITLGTSSQDRVRKRFDLMRARVEPILTQHPQQPRCFTLQLKKELFEADSTCGICGNAIQGVDDAAVDHVEQYWMGGKTIPENARLTHRYCNWARSKSA